MHHSRIEDHPVITIDDLKKAGVPGGRAGDHVPVSLRGIVVVITIADRSDKSIRLDLAFRDNGQPRRQCIFVCFSQQGAVTMPYLLCPEEVIAVRQLHLFDGRFASRVFWSQRGYLSGNEGSHVDRRIRKLTEALGRLAGTDGWPKARGKNREKLLRLVAESEQAPLPVRDDARIRLVRLAERQEARERSKLRSNRLSGPCSTAAALLDGEENPGAERLARQSRFPAESWRIPTIRSTPAFVPAPAGILEDYPALDLRVLDLATRMHGAEVWTHSLVWRDASGDVPPVLLVADFRDPLKPFLLLELGHEGGSSFQRLLVDLVATNPGAKGARWYLQCPVTGHRADYLLLREGRFASAKAHRLVHRSQRG